MLKNYLKHFAVYLSDYLSFILFSATTLCIIWFFLIDTSFLEKTGILENSILFGIVSAAASIEITALFFIFYFFRLKKISYFSDNRNFSPDMSLIFKYICIKTVSLITKVISLAVFFSPFFLSLSALVLLYENGISEKVFYILLCGSSLLFVTSLFSYSIFIQKTSFFEYMFVMYPYLSVKKLIKFSSETAEGNLFSLFKLKVSSIPKRMASLLIFPAIFLLPECLFDYYDFLNEKENPYPKKTDTEKTVVFYFDPIKGN